MKRILHCIESVQPSFGGPVAACAYLAAELNNYSCVSDVLTLDAPGEDTLVTAGNVHYAGPSIGFFRYCRGLRQWLDRHVPTYDLVLLHGFWRHHSAATSAVCTAAGIPYYVFTHSMLNPWFNRGLAKRLRKGLYWHFVERLTLENARAVIFGSEEEKKLAASAFSSLPGNKVICPLGIVDPGPSRGPDRFWHAFPEVRGRRLWLFLGRLHPVKGCDLLINAFGRLFRRCPDVRLVIAGPDSYLIRSYLETQAKEAGVADRILWTGELDAGLKWAALAAAELFVLPSHCESLSFSLVEALSLCLPAVITDKVNTHAILSSSGGVIVSEDTSASLLVGLEQWLALTEAQRHSMRQRARQSFLEHFEIGGCTRRLIALFRADLGWET